MNKERFLAAVLEVELRITETVSSLNSRQRECGYKLLNDLRRPESLRQGEPGYRTAPDKAQREACELIAELRRAQGGAQ